MFNNHYELFKLGCKMDLKIGDYVRLRNTHAVSGQISNLIQIEQSKYVATLRMSTGVRKFPSHQLELVPNEKESIADFIRFGHLPGPIELIRQISHYRLSGNLADVFYSMESSDTDFYAHQFKPVVKILESPTGKLLIADEVGLGKTIEAGLIWTELAARYKYNRLMVVCPKVLCEKWQKELATKFSIDAKIVNADELYSVLSNPFSHQNGFAVICGMQSIRPRDKVKRQSRGVDKLADFLETADGMQKFIDLLIIDEAHHMRNPGTATNALGELITAVSEHVAMLSATPINLHSRDLHSLLRLIDELTFRDEYALENIINANAPLVAARDAVLSGAPINDVFQMALAASRTPILQKTQALKLLVEELKLSEELTISERAKLARRLERVNLLSNVVNRTRRRDVEELRVHRNVVAYKAEMTTDERQVYDTITREIIRYSSRRDLPTGFLTVMPQRMLASSIPAAISHWQKKLNSFEYEDEDVDDDGNFTEQSIENIRPLVSVICSTLKDLPSANELEQQDSKFKEFLKVLRDQLRNTPEEKFVVFSTFRATLSYLEGRLLKEGFATLSMHGGINSRTELVDKFQNDPSISVLLASDVGSEGIDLQFARIVVNYDLPWNPMRVEQRIGRVDRLGQVSDSVSVLNLMYADTVDERIYHKLHERLKLCHKALGGFEEILGENISKLTKDILSGHLSSEEEEQRLNQTTQAIEFKLSEEEVLEKEAAALFAHGDFIIQSIHNSRSEGNWLKESDIVEYVGSSLKFLMPGSTIGWEQNEGLVKVRLTEKGQFKFLDWCKSNKLNSSPFGRSMGTIIFRVGPNSKKTRHPRLGPSHSFMRFISKSLEENDGLMSLATSIRMSAKDTNGIEPGYYVGAIEAWEFGKGAPSTTFGNALFSLNNMNFLEPKLADKLIFHSLSYATHWSTAGEEVDLELAAKCYQDIIEPDIIKRFFGELKVKNVELSDRISIQKASLDEHAQRQRTKLEQLIAASSKQLVAANKGKLARFEENVKIRELQIEAQFVVNPSSRTVAGYLLKLEP